MGREVQWEWGVVCFISISCGSFICSAGAQAQTERASGEKSGAQEKSRSLAPLGMTNLELGMTGQAATVPRLIKYSGTLKDGKGAPKNGVAGVTFAIYAEQEGGAPLWMETQNVMFDEGGRYTALLGANSSEGVPVELFNGSGE